MLLVFRTLRIGFPTLPVYVDGNGVMPAEQDALKAECAKAGAQFSLRARIAHDEWISTLLRYEDSPFWICDPDVVFHGPVEGFVNQETYLKGRSELVFHEPWTGTVTLQRLHTSLLYINPLLVRPMIREWVRRWHPSGFPFTPQVELIRQCYIPRGPGMPPAFQDTAAGLYNAIGGDCFTAEENETYDHLHCASYIHRMRDAIPGLQDAHRAVYNDHRIVQGVMREPQKEFYRTHHAT
jgi:hypothetical protein